VATQAAAIHLKRVAGQRLASSPELRPPLSFDLCATYRVGAREHFERSVGFQILVDPASIVDCVDSFGLQTRGRVRVRPWINQGVTAVVSNGFYVEPFGDRNKRDLQKVLSESVIGHITAYLASNDLKDPLLFLTRNSLLVSHGPLTN